MSGMAFGCIAPSLIQVEEHCKDLQRLLCSSHNLEVETGRHHGLEVQERKCKHDLQAIGDEQHFLFHCSCNGERRQRLERRLKALGREWDMETWIWALSVEKFGADLEQKRMKEKALNSIAAFVSKSLKDRKRLDKERGTHDDETVIVLASNQRCNAAKPRAGPGHQYH